MLFSVESIWTMIHGLVFGGGALMGLAALLFALLFMPSPPGSAGTGRQSAAVAALTVAVAVARSG